MESEVLRLAEFFDLFKSESTEWVMPENYVGNLDSSNESVTELFESLLERLEIDASRVRLHFSLEEVSTVSGMVLTHNSDSAIDTDSKQLRSDFKSDVVVGSNVVYSAVPSELVRILVTEKLILNGYVGRQ